MVLDHYHAHCCGGGGRGSRGPRATRRAGPEHRHRHPGRARPARPHGLLPDRTGRVVVEASHGRCLRATRPPLDLGAAPDERRGRTTGPSPSRRGAPQPRRPPGGRRPLLRQALGPVAAGPGHGHLTGTTDEILQWGGLQVGRRRQRPARRRGAGVHLVPALAYASGACVTNFGCGDWVTRSSSATRLFCASVARLGLDGRSVDEVVPGSARDLRDRRRDVVAGPPWGRLPTTRTAPSPSAAVDRLRGRLPRLQLRGCYEGWEGGSAARGLRGRRHLGVRRSLVLRRLALRHGERLRVAGAPGAGPPDLARRRLGIAAARLQRSRGMPARGRPPRTLGTIPTGFPKAPPWALPGLVSVVYDCYRGEFGACLGWGFVLIGWIGNDRYFCCTSSRPQRVSRRAAGPRDHGLPGADGPGRHRSGRSLTFNDGLATQYRYARPVLRRTGSTGRSTSRATGWPPRTRSTCGASARQPLPGGQRDRRHGRDHKDLTATYDSDPAADLAYKQDQVCGDRRSWPTWATTPRASPTRSAPEQRCGEHRLRLRVHVRSVGRGLSRPVRRTPRPIPPANAFALRTLNTPAGADHAAALQNAVHEASNHGRRLAPHRLQRRCAAARTPTTRRAWNARKPIDDAVLSSFLDWIARRAPRPGRRSGPCGT